MWILQEGGFTCSKCRRMVWSVCGSPTAASCLPLLVITSTNLNRNTTICNASSGGAHASWQMPPDVAACRLRLTSPLHRADLMRSVYLPGSCLPTIESNSSMLDLLTCILQRLDPHVLSVTLSLGMDHLILLRCWQMEVYRACSGLLKHPAAVSPDIGKVRMPGHMCERFMFRLFCLVHRGLMLMAVLLGHAGAGGQGLFKLLHLRTLLRGAGAHPRRI